MKNKFQPLKVNDKKSIQELVKETYEKHPTIMSELRSAEMSKFKVGDKVEYAGTSSPELIGEKGTVKIIRDFDAGVEFSSTGVLYVCLQNLSLVSDSPIRTVTATEIVAGTYGKVHIREKENGIGDTNIFTSVLRNSIELRESGEMLLKLADALDNGAKVSVK